MSLVSVSLLSLAGCFADAAPQIGTAVGANGRAVVTWEAPVGDNALTITTYVVTPYLGSAPQTPVSVSATARTAAVTGLTNGATYTFSVHGINAAGSETARSTQSNPVTPAVGIAVSVTSGADHTCALLTTGAVECWGANNYGQLGDGITTASSTTPVSVVGITDAVSISAGDDHTCAVRAGGVVVCWGYNLWGQVGNMAVTTVQRVPVVVYEVDGATAVSAGGSHTCAVETGGTVKCWGENGSGQLGNGTITPTGNPNPAPVAGLAPAFAVAAAGTSTCAALVGGAVSCWGSNHGGQLGNGGYTGSPTPVSVIGLTDVTSITVGAGHACARVTVGTIKCWGENGMGQLGNGVTDGTGSSTAVSVLGITSATAVDAGGSGTCAVLSTGAARCWGWNYYGQLGNGTTNVSAVPVAVTGVSTAIGIARSHTHSCASMTNGTLSCWGLNYYGQLGNGISFQSLTPVPVTGL